MDRKKFLKNCSCGLGSCVAAGMLAPASLFANGTAPDEDWRINFIKKRYAKLFGILSVKLNDEELTDTLRQLGAYCAVPDN